jgi:hypothetical protein
MYIYRVGNEKVARLPSAFAFGYCINFCIYAMLRTRATFSWPILYKRMYIYAPTVFMALL